MTNNHNSLEYWRLRWEKLRNKAHLWSIATSSSNKSQRGQNCKLPVVAKAEENVKFFSRLVPDLKWQIISRKPPKQGLKSHMSYHVSTSRNVNVIVGWTQHSPAECLCMNTSINQHPCPSGLSHSTFFLRCIKDASFLRRRKLNTAWTEILRRN